MTTAPIERLLTFEEFLASEADADRKHEYIAGYVYALAGAGRQLVRARTDVGDVGYYPDVQVVCDPTDQHQRYTERPCIIVEVLSDSTRRIDRGEKLETYTRIPSLQAYLVVWPDQRRIERHWRQDEAWHVEVVVGDGRVPFPCAGVALSLDEIYGPGAGTIAP
jgi:Uma2 family endonuclease